MKTLTEYLTFHTRERRELVRITDSVAELVRKSGIQAVTAGKLDLGPWQQVFYAGFDGQRRKRLVIKVMGE